MFCFNVASEMALFYAIPGILDETHLHYFAKLLLQDSSTLSDIKKAESLFNHFCWRVHQLVQQC